MEADDDFFPFLESDPLQLIQETRSLMFHNQQDRFRRFLHAISQYYYRNKAKHFDSDGPGLNVNNAVVATGSAISMRDNRPLPTESPAIEAHSVAILQFVNCNIKDLSNFFQIISFPLLSHCNLAFNSLKEFTLSELNCVCLGKSLIVLDLSHNKLSNLGFLSKSPSFSSLKSLRLHYNNIESLSPFYTTSFPVLEELWLSSNKLDWIEFIYLSKLETLKVLVKLNNPCDQKGKFNEFLQTFLPGLRYVDMEKIERSERMQVSLAPQRSTVKDREDGESKMSVDIKIMLTQAKAYLKKERRSSIALDEETKGEFRYLFVYFV
jgi:hypothetical protein